MAGRVALAVLVLGAIVVSIFAGWGGLVVYLFLAAIAGGVAWGVTTGGEWLQRSSRGRFRDDDRDR